MLMDESQFLSENETLIERGEGTEYLWEIEYRYKIYKEMLKNVPFGNEL